MIRSTYLTGALSLIFLFMVSVPNTAWGNKETIVSEKTAFEIAAVVLAQQVFIPSPSIHEEQTPELGWESARIGPPVMVHDINREPFAFIFPIIGPDNFIHSGIWVAANKLIGTTMIAVSDSMDFPDFDAAAERALRQATCRYPGWEVTQTLPVVYSYPRIGVMLTFSKPGTRETVDLIYDIYDLSEAPNASTESETDNTEFVRHISWSYFDQIPVSRPNIRPNRHSSPGNANFTGIV